MTRFSVSMQPDQADGQPPAKLGTSAAPTSRPVAGTDEPGMVLEPDLPSDGRDEQGEAMIRDLPQRPELSEPPSRPKPAESKP